MRYAEAVEAAPPGSDRFQARDVARLSPAALNLLFEPGPSAPPLEEAAAAFRQGPAGAGVVRACRVAAALWNERLFFEVHEVLEAAWKTAAGAERQGLQGVIQIAVAYHHLAHGNPRGARSLLAEGRSRLASVPTTTLPALDVARLLAATAPWEAALARRETPAEAPPRLALAAE